MGLYNLKWALILEDKFSLSSNPKRFKARKRRKKMVLCKEKMRL
jgi:hypothetical protein